MLGLGLDLPDRVLRGMKFFLRIEILLQRDEEGEKISQ